jgi:hypothetical protein
MQLTPARLPEVAQSESPLGGVVGAINEALGFDRTTDLQVKVSQTQKLAKLLGRGVWHRYPDPTG